MADIQKKRQKKEAREREEIQQQQQREEEVRVEEAGVEELHLQEEELAEKRPRTEISDIETKAGGEVAASQSRYKNWHITNVYLTDSDEEAIVDFLKDHKELHNKTSEHFKDKARKEFLWKYWSIVASSMSRCARPGLTHKGNVTGSLDMPQRRWQNIRLEYRTTWDS